MGLKSQKASLKIKKGELPKKILVVRQINIQFSHFAI